MMRRYNILLGLCWLATLPVWAVVAKPGSGVYGDEHYHYRLNPQGEKEGEWQAPSRNREQVPQISTTFPTMGEVRSLVILVNYKDVQFVTTNPKESFSRMLNEEGYADFGGTGSARDYFLQNSDNKFRPQFDVYGPVTLPHERAYYGGNGAEKNQQMIIDACDLLDGEINWSLYDVNKDGEVDNIFVYYAGHNEAEGGPAESVWPHRSYVYTNKDGMTYRYYYEYGGKRYWLWDYACTSELTGASGKRMCGIGTFCHEFSHVLGLDDLYNTRNSEIYTVGTWDIMCSGNYNNDGRTPPAFSAFERLMLGWLTPEQLEESQTIILPPLEQSNKAYLIAERKHNLKGYDADPKEYWLIENRQRVGWDKPSGALPGTGLLIWHIQFDPSRWDDNTPNNRTPLNVDICEAYNRNPSYSNSSDSYPGSYNITRFVPTTQAGKKLDKNQLINIHVINTTDMVFHHGEDDGSGFSISPDEPDTLVNKVLYGTFKEQQIMPIDFEGKKLRDTLLYITSRNTTCQISTDSLHWTTDTIWDRPAADSSYHKRIYLRHRMTQLCTTQGAVLEISTKNGMHSDQRTIYMRSERPRLIEPVLTTEAKDVSPYAFTATWHNQPDAAWHYLTVYSVEDEETTEKESISKSLQEEGQMYVSKMYPLALKKVKINYEHYFSSSGPKVQIEAIVEGREENDWEKVKVITLRTSTSSRGSWEIEMPAEKNYHWLRVRYHLIETGGKVILTEAEYTMRQTPVYKYKDTEYTMDRHEETARLENLMPNTDYYYFLVCEENRGCRPNITEPGKIMHVRTLPGVDDDRQLTIARDGNRLMAYLPHPASQGSQLLVYDMAGRLLMSIDLTTGESQYELPQEVIKKGGMYAVKYVEDGKMNRKGLWAKILNYEF